MSSAGHASQKPDVKKKKAENPDSADAKSDSSYRFPCKKLKPDP